MKESEPEYGEIVEIPWGNRYTVRATVNEVYGHRTRHVVVILTPELSDVVSEPTTLAVPLSQVKRITTAARDSGRMVVSSSYQHPDVRRPLSRREVMKETEPEFGEVVEIPWGNRYTVHATVNEVYGHAKRYVVVILTPELSDVVSEPETLAVPLSKVKRVHATD